MTTSEDFFNESLDMFVYGLINMKDNGATNEELRKLCSSFVCAISKFRDECLED